jgi:hypothetical protein
MVYNISKGVVHRSQRYLDDMLNAGKTLTWPTRKPSVLAYKIREALFAAQKHPEFTPYHKLKSWYRIHTRSGWVEAEYVGPISGSNDVHAPEGMTLSAYRTVEELVGACIKFERKADEIYFPNANLGEEQKELLYKWGGGAGWKLIDHGETGVTMTRKDDVEELFLWKPEDKND